MNAASASPAKQTTVEPATRKILVWDAPVRIFHWLMVLCFAGAYVTAEGEAWKLVHITLGYTMAGLVVFRLIWGLMGTRYARFSSFVRGPKAVSRYVGNLLRGKPEHHLGHNPAGAVAIVLLLVLTLVVVAAGWASYNELAGGWVGEIHDAAANMMLGVIGIHVAGVIVASWLHKENLVGSMIDGRKSGLPQNAVRSAWRTVSALMLAAVLGFWWTQWQNAPSSTGLANESVASATAGEHERDND
jgi:cytochrome b